MELSKVRTAEEIIARFTMGRSSPSADRPTNICPTA